MTANPSTEKSVSAIPKAGLPHLLPRPVALDREAGSGPLDELKTRVLLAPQHRGGMGADVERDRRADYLGERGDPDRRPLDRALPGQADQRHEHERGHERQQPQRETAGHTPKATPRSRASAGRPQIEAVEFGRHLTVAEVAIRGVSCARSCGFAS